MDYLAFNNSWWGWGAGIAIQFVVTALGVYWGLKWEKKREEAESIDDREHKINLLHEDVISLIKQLEIADTEFKTKFDLITKFPKLEKGYLEYNVQGQREILRGLTFSRLQKLRKEIEEVEHCAMTSTTNLIGFGKGLMSTAALVELALNEELNRLSKQRHKLNPFNFLNKFEFYRNWSLNKLIKKHK